MGDSKTCTDIEHPPPPASRALYVFCVLPQTAAVAVAEGLDGAPLESVAAAGVRAICCPVDLHAWTGEHASKNLSDLQWVGPRALQHELVNEQHMTTGPTLPLRFGTLFSTAQRVEHWLTHHSDEIHQFFATVEGAEEWAIRGWLCDQKCEDTLAAQDPRAADLPQSKGARYLQQKRLRRDAASRVRQWVADTGKEVVTALLESCLQVKPCPTDAVKSRHPTSDRCVLNFACLLPRGQVEQLREHLDKCAEPWEPYGLSFELNGPWPPYNFSPELASNS